MASELELLERRWRERPGSMDEDDRRRLEQLRAYRDRAEAGVADFEDFDGDDGEEP